MWEDNGVRAEPKTLNDKVSRPTLPNAVSRIAISKIIERFIMTSKTTNVTEGLFERRGASERIEKTIVRVDLSSLTKVPSTPVGLKEQPDLPQQDRVCCEPPKTYQINGPN